MKIWRVLSIHCVSIGGPKLSLNAKVGNSFGSLSPCFLLSFPFLSSGKEKRGSRLPQFLSGDKGVCTGDRRPEKLSETEVATGKKTKKFSLSSGLTVLKSATTTKKSLVPSRPHPDVACDPGLPVKQESSLKLHIHSSMSHVMESCREVDLLEDFSDRC